MKSSHRDLPPVTLAHFLWDNINACIKERKVLSGIGLSETVSASPGLQISKPCVYTDQE